MQQPLQPVTNLASVTLPNDYVLNGSYIIRRTLGQGGFGITYLAEEVVTGRSVVIKENFPVSCSMRCPDSYRVSSGGPLLQSDYDWALRSFLNEARVLAGLSHPNIVPVITAFTALGTAYYVMPYIAGTPLNQADAATVSEEWLRYFLRHMLGALDYLHGQNLLHRDIKPGNILLDKAGNPILIDFGTVRRVGAHTHTKTGTEGYAPLEQWASGGERGPWSDLYSLGATCYRLITGLEPPDCHDRVYADSDASLLSERRELLGRFSPALLAGIDRAFRMNPAERWQNARVWLKDLSGGSREKVSTKKRRRAQIVHPENQQRVNRDGNSCSSSGCGGCLLVFLPWGLVLWVGTCFLKLQERYDLPSWVVWPLTFIVVFGIIVFITKKLL
ncbi:MAG: serine/threonine-protein kinase [Akkermansia sp.]|nr:serine/threonine-protein kinase [Akkermansia sp.]